MNKKIGILLGEWSLPRRLDFWFNNIWESSRGLTGTDLAYVTISKELAKLGHDVHMFTAMAQPHHFPPTWEGCKLYNFVDRHAVIDNTFDTVISINEPDALRGLNTKAHRICWDFLNDFSYCQPGFDDFVDQWLSPCEEHMEYLKKQAPKPEKWSVMPLGCNPDWYQKDKKVPGRMIFCSSPDRGLFWALSVFPKIKKAVPEATLKIFYHMQEGSILNIEPNSTTEHPHVVEMANRLRYCKNAIQKMKHLGVEHIGSVSVNEMNRQMSEAEVLLYPVDTVGFTEGFSLSILQAHAAGAVPAITSADCLKSIYRDSGCLMEDLPLNLDRYSDGVINILKDRQLAESMRTQCLEFSKKFLWSDIANNISQLIESKK